MKKKKHPSRGGRRAGAGRKPIETEGNMQYVRFSEVPSRVKKLDLVVKKRGLSRSAFIRQEIRKVVDSE